MKIELGITILQIFNDIINIDERKVFRVIKGRNGFLLPSLSPFLSPSLLSSLSVSDRVQRISKCLQCFFAEAHIQIMTWVYFF